MARQADWQAEFQKQDLLPFGTDSKKQIKQYDFTNTAFWWYNPINKNSLRLAPNAFKMLTESKVPNWKIEITSLFIPRTYLQLEKYFTAPYFIKGLTNIILFSETDFMWITLHGNDLQTYLDNQDS